MRNQQTRESRKNMIRVYFPTVLLRSSQKRTKKREKKRPHVNVKSKRKGRKTKEGEKNSDTGPNKGWRIRTFGGEI